MGQTADKVRNTNTLSAIDEMTWCYKRCEVDHIYQPTPDQLMPEEQQSTTDKIIDELTSAHFKEWVLRHIG